jgi:putative ubiquitin-RnfH superfamily antitoxin RatB of RatAB toxin-antitoxin module
LEVDVLPNSTIEDAIQASQILQQFPEIDLATAQVGIFSKRAELTDRLQPRDRVEIYRSLTIDPKEARRLRVKKKSV